MRSRTSDADVERASPSAIGVLERGVERGVRGRHDRLPLRDAEADDGRAIAEADRLLVGEAIEGLALVDRAAGAGGRGSAVTRRDIEARSCASWSSRLSAGTLMRVGDRSARRPRRASRASSVRLTESNVTSRGARMSRGRHLPDLEVLLPERDVRRQDDEQGGGHDRDDEDRPGERAAARPGAVGGQRARDEHRSGCLSRRGRDARRRSRGDRRRGPSSAG